MGPRPRRAGWVGGAALALLAACTGGGGGRAGRPPTTPPPSSAPASTPSTAGPATTSAPDLEPGDGAVLRARGVVLPERSAAGSGLRLMVGPAPSYTVRRRGPVALEACTVDAGGDRIGCQRVAGDGPVEVGGGGAAAGLEVRQAGPDDGGGRAPVPVDEIALRYRPGGRRIVLGIPARPATGCGGAPCQASFELTPTGAGTFTLDARPQGGRPRITLLSGPADRAGSRSLATVEGGSTLVIRASVEAGSAPELIVADAQLGSAPALTLDLFWP